MPNNQLIANLVTAASSCDDPNIAMILSDAAAALKLLEWNFDIDSAPTWESVQVFQQDAARTLSSKKHRGVGQAVKLDSGDWGLASTGLRTVSNKRELIMNPKPVAWRVINSPKRLTMALATAL